MHSFDGHAKPPRKESAATGHACALILYAPNVHTGGGLVLLRALLEEWPAGQALRAVLDRRAIGNITLPEGAEVVWVDAKIASRFGAERLLARWGQSGGTIFCFHGLPPLFRSPAHVVLFQQNRLLLGLMRLRDFPLRTALRVAAERWISRTFRRNVDAYIVQTPSMARALHAWHGNAPRVTVLPFGRPAPDCPASEAEWDFVYVSDGLPHKNHQRLFEAWELLAADGIKPSLAVTLGPRDGALVDQLNALVHRTSVRIVNLGHIDHAAVFRLYASARALVFPSLGESFGLPLIEAKQMNLPILAPELDYVRDVCTPEQSFDGNSAISIARAVRRFLQVPEPVTGLRSPRDLWLTLQQ
jgi:glycosyltransferase involved in cell wall biosynthesis